MIAGWFEEHLIEKANLKRLKKKTENQYAKFVFKRKGQLKEINHLENDYFTHIFKLLKGKAFGAKVAYVCFL